MLIGVDPTCVLIKFTKRAAASVAQMFKEVGMSRNYEDDRYRDRNYGRREYSGRRSASNSYGRDRDWADRPSRRFEADDDEQFSGSNRFRERDYERQYGSGYDPGYGMSGQSRYPSRYSSTQ